MSALIDSPTSSARVIHLLERRGALIAAVAACLVYCVGLTNPFLRWDDDMYVTDNLRVQTSTWAALLELWNPLATLEGRFIEYSPLRDTIYWVLWAGWGDWPVPYHAAGIGLHAGASALVVVLARAMGIAPRFAAVAGILFAVHTIHVESVIWIACLKDPLYTSCFLVAAIAFLRWRDGGGAGALVVSYAAMVAGLLSKALMLVLPPSLAVLLLWRGERPSKKLVLALAGHFAIAAGFWPLIYGSARANDVVVPYPGGTLGTGLLTTAWAVVVYMSKALVPVGLNARHIMEPVVSPFEPRALIAAAVLLALLAGAFAAWHRERALTWALAFWIGNLVPVLNLIPHRVEVADRYQYAPSIAVVLVAAVLIARAAGRWPQATTGVVVVVVVAFAALTVRYVRVWGDEVRLWQDVAAQPDSSEHSFAWNQLGGAYERAGRREEARDAWDIALRAPDEFRGKPMANRARLALVDGDVPLALRLAREAALVDPKDADIQVVLAQVSVAAGDVDAALAAYARAIALTPRAATSWNRMLLAVRVGRIDEARADLARAVQASPELCTRGQAFIESLKPSNLAVASTLTSADPCLGP
jgi:tetratricopeptide (TPR) repeat protein